jgi:hypothetical protein
MKMNKNFWTSVAFGAVVAGVIWIVFVPKKTGGLDVGEDVEMQVSRKGVAETVSAAIFDRWPQTTEEKMEIVDSLSEAGFDDLERMLERWEDGRKRGQIWSFADWVVRSRMVELDPEKAWLWVEENLDERDTGDLKVEIKAEWAFQDLEGMLSFFKSRGGGESQFDLVKLDALTACRPRDWMRFWHYQSFQFSPVSNSRYVSSLKRGEECQEALEAWGNMPDEVREKWERKIERAENAQLADYYRQALEPSRQGLVQGVIRRWREVDEEGFLRSEFVGWEMDGE